MISLTTFAALMFFFYTFILLALWGVNWMFEIDSKKIIEDLEPLIEAKDWARCETYLDVLKHKAAGEILRIKLLLAEDDCL